jgi:hypothetical protein
MPRGGSKPGERRGGRQKGSLNKLSIGRVKADITTATPEFDSLDQLRLIAKHFLDQATAEGKEERQGGRRGRPVARPPTSQGRGRGVELGRSD